MVANSRGVLGVEGSAGPWRAVGIVGTLFLDQDSPGGVSTDAYREPVGHAHAHSGDLALAALPLDALGRAHTDSGNSASPGWSRPCSMGVFRRPSPEVGP